MEEVLTNTTDRLLLVLDNLHDAHNLSAILRTAEAETLRALWVRKSVPHASKILRRLEGGDAGEQG